MSGGFTGSYIFSQTIFLMRAGVDSKLACWAATVLQFGFFLMPTSPLPYIPNFFFGCV
jgi:SulP family sulfate permease